MVEIPSLARDPKLLILDERRRADPADVATVFTVLGSRCVDGAISQLAIS